MPNDSEQRLKAIQPQHSYIVQAPAGSGKTEILTQRYLKLLSLVKAPEQIIAITFTKKAANEMRERIILALQEAKHNTAITNEHQKLTRDIAYEALNHNEKMQWQILEQPNRLKIMTIDALCQMLMRAIPILEKQIPYANICNYPEKYYKEAARASIKYAEEDVNYQSALQALLLHVDNQQDYLIELFVGLLSKREQWLQLLYQAKAQDQKSFEKTLQFILNHEIERFKSAIPNDLKNSLFTCVQQLLRLTNRLPLELDELTPSNLHKLANLLLTSQNSLRKMFDHHVGLKKGICNDEELNQLKTFSKEILSQLNELPFFVDNLIRVKNLPNPYFQEEQWSILQDLFTLLPLLAAHLQLIFIKNNEVDFIGVTEQALLSLGDEDAPTDLTLYLDHTIQHLLIDEFQDTSTQHFKLISQLVQGWQRNDGRTLFIVGDPMQSIYRFRSAEVGLFLKAKTQGIGPVKLISLDFTSNFRSTPFIVHWVNERFQAIFPNENDIESGAISFHTSTPIKTADTNSIIKAFEYQNAAEEATAIIDLIETQLKDYPEDNIAILVRSRSHLALIVGKLREKQIPFQGIEIDLLAKLPHLRDIWSLTQALLMPSNRLAWLAFLRSPWCGLSLKDLLVIATFDKHKSILYALEHVEYITKLNASGKNRIKFVYQVLQQALTERSQTSLVVWIENTLKALHYEQILNPSQQSDVEQFWLLLDKFDVSGLLHDLNEFKVEFNKLYSLQVTPSRLQIMTIHKSKGLEFDTIILPGLGSKPSNLERPLLRWLKLPSQNQDLLLLSPIKASHQEHSQLYDYLGKLDNEKALYEVQRLLYVAVTRAKKRLFLFDNQTKITKDSFRELLITQEFISSEQNDTAAIVEDLPKRHYLPQRFYDKQICNTAENSKSRSIVNFFGDDKPRLIGIISHELSQWICNHHPTSIEQLPWQFVNQQLRMYGFNEQQINSSEILIKQQIEALFLNPIGKWIIQKHLEEHNEYEIIIQEHGKFLTRIIDRTFYENGKQWIIDFKTGLDDEVSLSTHKLQLEDYAKALAKMVNYPIHLGLFYLATSRWVSWETMHELVNNH